jgi:hypothetical protein
MWRVATGLSVPRGTPFPSAGWLGAAQSSCLSSNQPLREARLWLSTQSGF